MASSETFMSFCLCREMPRRGVSTRPPYSGPVKAKGSGEPFFRNGETPRKLPPNLRQAAQVFLGNFHRISAKRCAVFFGTSSEPLLYVAGFSRKLPQNLRQATQVFHWNIRRISAKRCGIMLKSPASLVARLCQKSGILPPHHISHPLKTNKGAQINKNFLRNILRGSRIILVSVSP